MNRAGGRFIGEKVHAGVEPEKGINAMKVAAEAIAAVPVAGSMRRRSRTSARGSGGDAHDPDLAGHEFPDASLTPSA